MADLVRIDDHARQAWLGETLLPLRPMEYRLLHELVSHAGVVLPVRHLLREVWGTDVWGMRGTVYMTLVRLRKALGDDAKHPTYITTIDGGLRFEAAMLAPSQTRVVDIDGRRYTVLHWEKHPYQGATQTFTLYARPVEAVSDGHA